MLGLGLGLNKLRSSGLSSILLGAMVWGRKSLYKWGETSTDIWGFANPNDIDPESQAIYDRIIADGGVSNLTRLNYFVVGLKTIYGTLANVPVCYDAHWIGYKLGSGTGATAGQAAAKLYSLTVAGDAVQTTAASQPLLLAHNGASSDNYYYVPRVDGNNCTTPDTVASRIAGDIEIISYIELKGTEADRTIIAKGGLSVGNFVLAVGSSNIPYFIQGDLVLKNATAALPNVNTWLRVTRVSSTGDIKFWTSTDAKTTAPLSVTWTQLGSTVSGTAGNRSTTTDSIFVGKYNQYTNNSFNGNIFRATVSNVIGGTPVVDFNAASYNAATSQTAWTSATGEVWTINTGTATTGYKGVLVDRTIVQGDGVDDLMAATTTSKQFFSLYLAINGYSSAGNVALFNGATVNTHLIFQTSAASISANNGASLAFGGEVANRIYCATVNFNSTNSDTLYNNANKQTGNTGTNTSSGYNIFGGAGNSFSNTIYNTLIATLAVDSVANNTATYNLIRSLNNNAF
jgi:hypothetical protein